MAFDIFSLDHKLPQRNLPRNLSWRLSHILSKKAAGVNIDPVATIQLWKYENLNSIYQQNFFKWNKFEKYIK